MKIEIKTIKSNYQNQIPCRQYRKYLLQIEQFETILGNSVLGNTWIHVTLVPKFCFALLVLFTSPIKEVWKYKIAGLDS